MSKVMLSLNFMHCMERFATQIYKTQMGKFKGAAMEHILLEASVNEQSHVDKLYSRIKQLHGHVYPFGWLFQLAGFKLGWITRLGGKKNLFGANTFVEKHAVQDYGSFLKSVNFDAETADMIKKIIADEVEHVASWTSARKAFGGK